MFSLDRAAVDIAQQLSKKLDEAPNQEGCPFMLSKDLSHQPSGNLQGKSCPFSSANFHSQMPMAAPHLATRDACPVSGATTAVRISASTTSTTAATGISKGDSHVTQPQLDDSLKSQRQEAAAKCPFHLGQEHPSSLPALPHPTSDAEKDRGGSQAQEMTDETLKEYEQAFAMDPDEAMLQAYASLLADKVAEADSEADETHRDPCSDLQQSGVPSQIHSVPQKDGKVNAGRPTGTQGCRQSSKQDSTSGPMIISNASHSGACSEAAAAAAAPSAEHTQTDATTGDSLCNAVSHTAGDVRAQGSSTMLESIDQDRANGLRSCWQLLRQQSARWHVLMIACFGIQISMGLYFGLVHQR